VTDSAMPAKFTRITLIAPGCFSSLADPSESESRGEPVRDATELNDAMVLQTANHSYEQSLAAAFNQPIPALGALPVAQYRFLFDTDKKAPPHCVCTELIHLQADKDNARLLPMQALDVTDDEAEQLVEALNQLIIEDGLEVLRTSSHHYYLTGMSAAALDTWPAHAVANGKIANYLPRQAEAGDWRRLMTEVQMLFHDHPVNTARANAHQLPINGMWFWGGAQPLNPLPKDNIELISADAYTNGFAKTMGITPTNPGDVDWANLESQATEELIIVELTVYEAWLRGDHAALRQAKQDLHDQWITPAQNAVASGLCNEFVLDGCEGQAIAEKRKQPTGHSFRKRFSIAKLLEHTKRLASNAQNQTNKSDSNS